MKILLFKMGFLSFLLLLLLIPLISAEEILLMGGEKISFANDKIIAESISTDGSFVIDEEGGIAISSENIIFYIQEEITLSLNGYTLLLSSGDTLSYSQENIILTLNKQEICSNKNSKQNKFSFSPDGENFYSIEDTEEQNSFCNFVVTLPNKNGEAAKRGYSFLSQFDGYKFNLILNNSTYFSVYSFLLNFGDLLEFSKGENISFSEVTISLKDIKEEQEPIIICGREYYSFSDNNGLKYGTFSFSLEAEENSKGICKVYGCLYYGNKNSEGPMSVSCGSEEIFVLPSVAELNGLKYADGIWSCKDKNCLGIKGILFYPFTNGVESDFESAISIKFSPFHFEAYNSAKRILLSDSYNVGNLQINPLDEKSTLFKNPFYVSISSANILESSNSLEKRYYLVEEIPYKLYFNEINMQLELLNCCDESEFNKGSEKGSGLLLYGCGIKTQKEDLFLRKQEVLLSKKTPCYLDRMDPLSPKIFRNSTKKSTVEIYDENERIDLFEDITERQGEICLEPEGDKRRSPSRSSCNDDKEYLIKDTKEQYEVLEMYSEVHKNIVKPKFLLKSKGLYLLEESTCKIEGYKVDDNWHELPSELRENILKIYGLETSEDFFLGEGKEEVLDTGFVTDSLSFSEEWLSTKGYELPQTLYNLAMSTEGINYESEKEIFSKSYGDCIVSPKSYISQNDPVVVFDCKEQIFGSCAKDLKCSFAYEMGDKGTKEVQNYGDDPDVYICQN